MHTKKRTTDEEIPIKLTYTEIDDDDKKNKKLSNTFEAERQQMARMEEKRKIHNDIISSLLSTIDKYNIKHKDAITNEEKVAIIDRIRQLMMSLEQEQRKEKELTNSINALRKLFNPKYQANERIHLGTYRVKRGYTENEKQELLRLIDSVGNANGNNKTE